MANNQPLRSALARSMKLEIYEAQGKDSALVLLDVEKFYASIPLMELFTKATEMVYPVRCLLLSFTQYLATRVIRAQGWLSRPIVPGCSVAAGEGAGTHMAKIMLYDILEWYHGRWAQLPIKQWLDDLVSVMGGGYP